MQGWTDLTTAMETVRSLPWWFAAKPSDRPHIFITGAPRSGTTLLKTILTAHSKIAGGDYESTGLFRLRNLYTYACGELDNSEIRTLLGRTRGLTQFYNYVADRLLEYWGGNYFVDKVWPRAYRLRFVTRQFPQSSWIHIVRDGRDCYCSARKHPNVPQAKQLEYFARYWTRCIELVEDHVPESKLHVVKYEDMTADPDREIARIMAFLKLQVEEGQFHPSASSRIPSIRKAAYHQRLTQPLDTTSVGRSKEELSEGERSEFWRIAGESLGKWGYQP